MVRGHNMSELLVKTISGILLMGYLLDIVGYQPFLQDSLSDLRDQPYHMGVMALTTSNILTSYAIRNNEEAIM